MARKYEPTSQTDPPQLKRQKSFRDDFKKQRKYKMTIVLFGVLNVLLLVLNIITVYYIASENQDDTPRDVRLCVPCDDIKTHPEEKTEGIVKENNGTTCCAKDANDTERLVGYFVDHWLKEKLATDNDRTFQEYKCNDDAETEDHKPTIKVVGKSERQSAEHHKLLWDDESEHAININPSLISHHLHHGMVEIKKSGMYQVYSQVVFDHDMNSHRPNAMSPMYLHEVVLVQSGQVYDDQPPEKSVLKNANSHCTSSSNKQSITSYISGVFQLDEGDRLAVKVHNKTEVVPVPHMNFFGVHMM